ncbi:homeodomain-interacting protein kinase 4-like [Nothobranchius furzeri]|uniref:Homeodomain-interacting protein kinase 4-like n=1 Tax=Nothobranchius furzeri TaxID=105023 RepID=A0A9D2YE82_NOTFU|nr:homeodomain-interacting protein kinase 4-like [Nothobranchius furzeri]
MISLLGPPPMDLLNTGRKTEKFFHKTDNQWLLKDSQKYFTITRSCRFRTLGNGKIIKQEIDSTNEASERKECIELLKAMLNWDANERIMPSEILAHPFITVDYSRFSSSSLESISMLDPEPCTSRALNLHESKAFAPRMCWEAKSSDSNTCEDNPLQILLIITQ